MSYLAKNEVVVKSRTIGKGDRAYKIFEAYLGVNPMTKKPVRKSAKSEEKLKRIITDFYKRLGSGGETAVMLSPYESMDARRAIDMLNQAGAKLTLVECVRRIMEDGIESWTCTTTVGDAYEEYLKRQQGKSKDHRSAVTARVGKWVTIFGPDRLLSDVTAKLVASDLEKRLYNPKDESTKTTYNNHLGYIKTFLRWCADSNQKYLKSDPLASMKPMVKGWRDPEYMSASDVELIFREFERTSPIDLADAILSFFCGLRQCEIRNVRLGPEAITINLDENYIRVIKCKGTTRGVKPRAFTIPPTARAWIDSFDFMEAVMKPNRKFRESLVEAGKKCGVTVPENAGRHTFITMFTAAYHDQARLSAIAGNTEDVRDKHYDGVGTEKDGKAYFNILPSTCSDGISSDEREGA